MHLHRLTGFQLRGNTVFLLIIKLLAGIHRSSVHIPQKRSKYLVPGLMLSDEIPEHSLGIGISLQADSLRSLQPPVNVLAAKYPLRFSAAHIQVQGFPSRGRRLNILIKVRNGLLVGEAVLIVFRRIHQFQQARQQKGRHIAHPVPNAAVDKAQKIQYQADGRAYEQDEPNHADPAHIAPNGIQAIVHPIGQRHSQGVEALGLIL